ncbi:MAG: hypothetical protein KDI56_17495 [Xanthomonadales bacterium]|nr:hypothetical protein [Xanthomonadales bacterium]
MSEGKGGLQSSPESASVTTAGATLEFVLVGSAATDYRITGYNSTDTANQLSSATISADGITMLVGDANTAAETMNIYVTVEHRKHSTKHQIDPQVINRPPN